MSLLRRKADRVFKRRKLVHEFLFLGGPGDGSGFFSPLGGGPL
jgi:hypothetical protein